MMSDHAYKNDGAPLKPLSDQYCLRYLRFSDSKGVKFLHYVWNKKCARQRYNRRHYHVK